MKKQIALILASFAILIGMSIATNAQVRRIHNINAREREQQNRITQGIRSGELTNREAARLENEQSRLDRIEARYRASGGGLTRSERIRLERDLNRTSHDIYHQKHDGQVYVPRP